MRFDIQVEPDVNTFEGAKVNGKAPEPRPTAPGPQWPKPMQPGCWCNC